MMRETRKSLKVYFIVIGVLGILAGSDVFVIEGLEARLGSAFALIGGILFLYYGIKLYRFLEKSPKQLITLVAIVMSLNIIGALAAMAWIYMLAYILIGWYLISSIKRLSGRPAVNSSEKGSTNVQ